MPSKIFVEQVVSNVLCLYTTDSLLKTKYLGNNKCKTFVPEGVGLLNTFSIWKSAYNEFS